MITRKISDKEMLTLMSREESHIFYKKSIAISGKGVPKKTVPFVNADGSENKDKGSNLPLAFLFLH